MGAPTRRGGARRAACARRGAAGGLRAGRPGRRGQPAARKITGPLVFWPEGGQTNASYQAWVARIADFQKAYPEARVEMMETQDRDAKLVTAVAAGTPPDVSVFDRYTIFGASQRGIMQDLQPLAKVAGIKGEDQQPWCWDEVFRDGKLWGLPYSTDTRMVYVNAAHLKQAGIPLTAPKTLDEFDQAHAPAHRRAPREPSSASASSPGPTTGASSAGAGCTAATGTTPRPTGSPWTTPRTSPPWTGRWPGRTSWGATTGVEAFRNAQPKNGLTDMLKAGTLSATINSNSQLIGMFAEKDLDWIVWAPPAGRRRRPHPHLVRRLRQRRSPPGSRTPRPRSPWPASSRTRTFQKVQNKTGGGRLPTIKAVASDPHWNTVDPRVKQFVDLLPFSHIRPPIVQIAILNRELDGPGGRRDARPQGRRTPPARPSARANQRVNDAIKEGRAD